MIYEYDCNQCHFTFDRVKHHLKMNDPEECPKCQAIATRKFVPSRVYFSKTKVEHAEYNPGLGMVIKNSKHRAEVAKAKGLIEIGNENPDKLHESYEKDRTNKIEREWDNTLKEAHEIAQSPSAVESLMGDKNG